MSARSVCKRHLAVGVMLGARDFGAAETAGDLNFDAARAGLHRAHDRLLHGAPERDALLELIDDVLADETRVELGMLDLDDVDLNALAGQMLEALADVFDPDAALADDDTGLGGVDDHARLIGAPLDLDLLIAAERIQRLKNLRIATSSCSQSM